MTGGLIPFTSTLQLSSTLLEEPIMMIEFTSMVKHMDREFRASLTEEMHENKAVIELASDGPEGDLSLFGREYRGIDRLTTLAGESFETIPGDIEREP